MPRDVVGIAQNFISDENIKFENVIKNLESVRNELEKEKEDVQKIKRKLNAEMANVQKEKTFVKTWCESELKSAKTKSENIVSNARAMADELIDEIKKIKKSLK